MGPCLVVALVAGLLVGDLGARADAEPAPAPAPIGGTRPAEIGARLARLESELAGAERDLITVSDLAERIAVDLDAARAVRVRAQSRLGELDHARAEAEDELDRAEDRVAEVVRSAYVGGGDSLGLLADFLDSADAAELERRRVLTRSVGDSHDRAVRDFRSARRQARGAASDARAAHDQVDRRVRQLEDRLPALSEAVVTAEADAARARFAYDRWESVRFGPATPILGVARLTGEELARWFRAQRSRARITVPIAELAQIFIEEGDAAGVRGDIAFAQSVLETGGFFFPDHGQVRPADNNFAGIGACDSCSTGRTYPDARSGVRAQMQLLRAYADAAVTAESLGNPPVDPAVVGFFLRGRAPTWSGLTGTWATSTTYAPKIFDLYFRMLAWVTDDPGGRR